MNRRTLVGCHKGFAEESGAEVRNDDGHVGMSEPDPRHRQRIAETQVEAAGQTQLLAYSHGQHAAMHEHDSLVLRRGPKHTVDGVIVHTVAVHRRKEADAADVEIAQRALQDGLGGRLRRVVHEEADEAIGMVRDRFRDGRGIAGNARDQRRALNVVTIELCDPPVSELGRGTWRIPLETRRQRLGTTAVWREELEEPRREEMAMCVVKHVRGPRSEVRCDYRRVLVGLIADTHGLVRPEIFTALDGVALILHAGDVGGQDVLAQLQSIAPLHAVYGNTDPPGEPGLRAHVALTLEGKSIHVSHGHELGQPTPARLLARYDANILIYGHTHRALIEQHGDRLVINPGAAGPRRFDVKPSVARLTLNAGGTDVQLVWL
jgi:putative phosphoesterase